MSIYERAVRWSAITVIVLLSTVMMGANGCEPKAPVIPPGDKSFEVDNGLMTYIVDPLNGVCIALYERVNGVVLLPYDDCLRIIRRYTMPLPELKSEVEELDGE